MKLLPDKNKFLILVILIFCLGGMALPVQAAQLLQTGSQEDGITVTVSATPSITESLQNTPSLTATTPVMPTETAPSFTTTASTPTPTIAATCTVSPSLTLTPTPLVDSITATPTPSPTVTLQPTYTSTISPTNNLPEDYVPNEVLIKVDPSSSLAELTSYLEDINANVTSEISGLGIMQIEVSGGDIKNLVDELGSLPGVLHAEPNYYTQVLETNPNDPKWSDQYGLGAINAPQGWDLATGSNAVTIAILDTGVDQFHPDLSGKIVPGYDFIELDADPQDDNGHGTHVAGIAAAATNNGVGIAGTAWGARIMPIKVLNSVGNGSYAGLAAGIIWATDQGAQVINLSLGGAYPSAVLEDAIDYAYAHGVVQVAASGNSGSGTVLYPALYTHVIAVGATDPSNNLAGFSNYGLGLDLVAPGSAIFSTMMGGGYGNRSGTSMSTPFVSGLAAILAGIPRPYFPDLISYEMESTALDLGTEGKDDYYGHGLIQMDAAIRLAIPTPTPTSTPIPTFTPSATSSDAAQTDSTETHLILPSVTHSPTLSPTPTPIPTSTPTGGGPTPTYTDIPEEEKVVAFGMATPTPTVTRQSNPEQKSPSVSVTPAPRREVSEDGGVGLLLVGAAVSGVGVLGWLLRKRLMGRG